MEAMTNADREALGAALGSDGDAIAAEVATGESQLIRYPDGSRIVLRLEERIGAATELVIVAGAGTDATGKARKLVEVADSRGWSIRFHTRRPALGRLLGSLGFTEQERVYTHGR